VQWDGSHISVELLGPHKGVTLYQLHINGSTATIAKTIKFDRVWHAGQSWIQGNMILIPYNTQGSEFKKVVGFWKYPKGRKVVLNVKKFMTIGDLQGVTFSAALLH